MCQKIKTIWQCGHWNIEDPRKCRTASIRNKSCCQEYGFAWAFRPPVVETTMSDCLSCQCAIIEKAKRDANKKFVERSQAYPRLRNVSAHDDEKRRKYGRPRFDRRPSTSDEIVHIPSTWTSEYNRLPSNANEYDQFVRGRFNPLEQLSDSHMLPVLTTGAGLFHQDADAKAAPRGRQHASATLVPRAPNTTSGVVHQVRPVTRAQLPNTTATKFQPERHMFTATTDQVRQQQQQKSQAAGLPAANAPSSARQRRTTTPASGYYRSKAPPPGYAPQMPRGGAPANNAIAQRLALMDQKRRAQVQQQQQQQRVDSGNTTSSCGLALAIAKQNSETIMAEDDYSSCSSYSSGTCSSTMSSISPFAQLSAANAAIAAANRTQNEPYTDFRDLGLSSPPTTSGEGSIAVIPTGKRSTRITMMMPTPPKSPQPSARRPSYTTAISISNTSTAAAGSGSYNNSNNKTKNTKTTAATRKTTKNALNKSGGWLPPLTGPLPPKQETDTAPPSRSPSVERNAMSGCVGGDDGDDAVMVGGMAWFVTGRGGGSRSLP
ncbi:hypothetical protein AAFC00_005732 [Neodothiora populina]|uniref:Uncharacterized protein n=1 Tax=Neodothiora populina TaxID=2781224 RepID=A0ABR3P5Z5_9PEZI